MWGGYFRSKYFRSKIINVENIIIKDKASKTLIGITSFFKEAKPAALLVAICCLPPV
jgi:hypothetical protein